MLVWMVQLMDSQMGENSDSVGGLLPVWTAGHTASHISCPGGFVAFQYPLLQSRNPVKFVVTFHSSILHSTSASSNSIFHSTNLSYSSVQGQLHVWLTLPLIVFCLFTSCLKQVHSSVEGLHTLTKAVQFRFGFEQVVMYSSIYCRNTRSVMNTAWLHSGLILRSSTYHGFVMYGQHYNIANSSLVNIAA